jgi:hypothetical protein
LGYRIETHETDPLAAGTIEILASKPDPETGDS